MAMSLNPNSLVEEQIMNNEEKRLELNNPTIYQKNDNCQVFNAPISGCVFAMPGSVVHQNAAKQEEACGEAAQPLAEELDDDVDLVDGLLPIFYNNEGDVREFLKEINGMSANDITDLVNQWVKDKRISNYGYSRKGILWKILKEAGLYSKSRQNWCRRVD